MSNLALSEFQADPIPWQLPQVMQQRAESWIQRLYGSCCDVYRAHGKEPSPEFDSAVWAFHIWSRRSRRICALGTVLCARTTHSMVPSPFAAISGRKHLAILNTTAPTFGRALSSSATLFRASANCHQLESPIIIHVGRGLVFTGNFGFESRAA